jgi:hypothetical protein
LWPNLLSLDAPLIAVLWLHLASATFGVHPAPQVNWALALVVWLIYAADRLFDGMRADPSALLTPRHRFYRAHQDVFIPLVIAVVVVTAWACFQLDFQTFTGGVLLMFVVGVYFAAVHCVTVVGRFRLPKEATVAAIFGVGTFLPLWTHAHGSIARVAVPLLLFVLICWLNLVLIEYAEWVTLRQSVVEEPHASTIAAGKRLSFLGLVVVAGTVWLTQQTASKSQNPFFLATALSALALAALAYSWRKLSLNAVRALADAALLTPALILLFPHP